MTVNRIKKGDKLTVPFMNRLIDEANSAGDFSVGPGFVRRRGKGGNFLGKTPRFGMLQEPAHIVNVDNVGDKIISAYAPAGIAGSGDNKSADLYNQRNLKVRVATAEDAGNIVIAQNAIEPGRSGKAWCTGYCLVRIMRWFDTDMLDKADVFVDSERQYVLASAVGCLDIIYEQTDPNSESDVIQLNVEHLAICRFNGNTFTKYINKGATTIPFGGVVLQDASKTTGLSDGPSIVGRSSSVLAGLSPVSQAARPAFINLGGDVEAGKYGRCFSGVGMAAVKEEYDVTASVGSEVDETLFSSSGAQFNVLAQLGEPTGSSTNYAVIAPATTAPSTLLQIIGGNLLSDGSTQGIKYSSTEIPDVPSLYDPNVDTSFIDGIGRAWLFINGVFQSGYVLVVNDTRSGLVNRALWNDDRVLPLAGQVSIPLASDPTQSVTAYVPWFM